MASRGSLPGGYALELIGQGGAIGPAKDWTGQEVFGPRIAGDKFASARIAFGQTDDIIQVRGIDRQTQLLGQVIMRIGIENRIRRQGLRVDDVGIALGIRFDFKLCTEAVVKQIDTRNDAEGLLRNPD